MLASSGHDARLGASSRQKGSDVLAARIYRAGPTGAGCSLATRLSVIIPAVRAVGGHDTKWCAAAGWHASLLLIYDASPTASRRLHATVIAIVKTLLSIGKDSAERRRHHLCRCQRDQANESCQTPKMLHRSPLPVRPANGEWNSIVVGVAVAHDAFTPAPVCTAVRQVGGLTW